MGKGGGTQTTTSNEQTAYAPWTQSAQQGAAGAGFNLNQHFLQTPGFSVAAMNPDQMRAIDQARLTMLQGNAGGSPSVRQGGVPQGGAPQTIQADVSRRDPGMQGQVFAHPPMQANGSHNFMNPYLDSVGKSTLGAMNKEYMNTDANIAARYAGMGALGGSGAAIARGQAARGHNEASGAMTNQLMAQGFNQAQDRVFANEALALQQAQAQSGLMDADIRRQIGTQENLMQRGNQQQLFAQTAIDTPMRALERYAAMIPQVYNSNTAGERESPDNSPNPLMQILGMGAQMASAYLSDEGLKTNIEPVGEDPETGLMMYAYDYIADVEAAERDGAPMPPKRVGPMAQEIAEGSPGSVHQLEGRDGSLVVDADAMPGVGLVSHMMGKK
jgi:hypothetical protein